MLNRSLLIILFVIYENLFQIIHSSLFWCQRTILKAFTSLVDEVLERWKGPDTDCAVN